MSGELSGLSNAQKQSLAGQILAKLDNKDGNSGDGKIKKSIWDDFWKNNNLDDTKGGPETKELAEDAEDIDIQTAFKYIMTRIFNAAKKTITTDKWNNNGQDKNNAINTVAKEWLNKAGNIGDAGGAGDVGDADEAGGADGTDGSHPEETDTVTNPNVTNANTAISEATDAKSSLETLTDVANTAIEAANEAESKEEAEAKIKDAEQKLETAKQKLKEAKNKAQEARTALQSATNEDGYEAANGSLQALNQAIIDAEQALNTAQTALDTAKTAANNKPTKKELTEAKFNENGAKLESERLINGTKQKYYKYKDKETGETVRAVIDENGNEDRLIQISGGGLSKKQFITTSQLNSQIDGLTYIPEGFECEVEMNEGTPTLKFKKGKTDATNDIEQYAQFRNGLSNLQETWFDSFSDLEPQEKGGEYQLGPIKDSDRDKAKAKFQAYLKGMKQGLNEYKANPCQLDTNAKIRFEQKMYELSLLKPEST